MKHCWNTRAYTKNSMKNNFRQRKCNQAFIFQIVTFGSL
jgi:hypothetical protein